MAVPLDEWFGLIEREYLDDFISAGGAAAKFLVLPPGRSPAEVGSSLDDLAAARGYVRAHIDSAATKLHLIQDVFFGIARQIDWMSTAQRFLERLFQNQKYEWPEAGHRMTLHDLARANGFDVAILRRDVRKWLTDEIMKERGMVQEFRIAMAQLCLESLNPEDSSSVVTPIVEWLRGELRTMGALKSAQIFSKITRTNARPMLRSLCRWLRMLGHPGLVLSMDLVRIPQTALMGDGAVRYSAAAAMDAYEVLRQLIDGLEHFEGMLLVAIADGGFISGDTKRSVSAYTALQARIWDDVRDRNRDNPLAPLVAIGPSGGAL